MRFLLAGRSRVESAELTDEFYSCPQHQLPLHRSRLESRLERYVRGRDRQYHDGELEFCLWPMGKQSLFLLREEPWKSRPLRSVRSELYMWDTQWSIHYSTLCFIEHSRCCSFIVSWTVTFFPSEFWQVAYMNVPTFRPLVNCPLSLDILVAHEDVG